MSQEPRSWFSRLFNKSGDEVTDSVDAPEDHPTHASMNCREVRSSASDFVDGEGTTSLSDVIKRHLGLCRDCDSWVKTFAATVGLVRQVPQEEVPDSLRQRIRQIPGSEK